MEEVTVFYNGLEITVPAKAKSLVEAKRFLGCPEDHVLAFKADPPRVFADADEGWAFMEDEEGNGVIDWDFREGQIFRSFPRDEVRWDELYSSDSAAEQLADEILTTEDSGHEDGCDCWVCRRLDRDPAYSDPNADTDTNIETVTLSIDGGELDNLTPQKIFMLGLEYGQIRSTMEVGFEGRKLVFEENIDRLMILAKSMGFKPCAYPDQNDGWVAFEWTMVK